MKEELGDVLLQVVFHTQMEKEKGTFDIDDVADGICKKLIFRHPHIFGNVEVASSEELPSGTGMTSSARRSIRRPIRRRSKAWQRACRV